MQERDTINLLKECNSGLKMAVNSINDIIEKVRSRQIHAILEQSLHKHEKIGNEVHSLLNAYNETTEKPGKIAKAMSRLMVNMKFIKTPTDYKLAEIMYDGCNMGIRSIYHYKNMYSDASGEAKSLASQIIENEKYCMTELQKYL
ncbi:MAG: hypothetical protein IKK96_03970 [Lachnospiraceae bacterium]|nr:hypothetical protein [Lachnospiraceae bacterium]